MALSNTLKCLGNITKEEMGVERMKEHEDERNPTKYYVPDMGWPSE